MYAPTVEADDEDHEEFYGKLQDAVAIILKGDIIIVTGNFNAIVGEEPTSKYMEKYGLWKEMMQIQIQMRHFYCTAYTYSDQSRIRPT